MFFSEKRSFSELSNISPRFLFSTSFRLNFRSKLRFFITISIFNQTFSGRRCYVYFDLFYFKMYWSKKAGFGMFIRSYNLLDFAHFISTLGRSGFGHHFWLDRCYWQNSIIRKYGKGAFRQKMFLPNVHFCLKIRFLAKEFDFRLKNSIFV